MKIVNLTPHALNFIGADDEIVLTVPSSGVARAKQFRFDVGSIEAGGAVLPVTHTTYGEVEGLPEPEWGTIYVVSALTAQAVPERADVYITDDAVRDDAGRVIGCRGLARV